MPPAVPHLDLGPARLRFDRYGATPPGRRLVRWLWVMFGLAVALFGLTAWMSSMLLRSRTAAALLPLVGLLLLLCLVLLGLVLEAIRQVGRASVTLHDHGISLRQPWWFNRQFGWAEVQTMIPPGQNWPSHQFHLVLSGGRQRLVTRLNLPPQPGPDGTLHHHPDVQATLAFFAAHRHR